MLVAALGALRHAQWESIGTLGDEPRNALGRAGTLEGVQAVALFGGFTRVEAHCRRKWLSAVLNDRLLV